MDNLETSSPMTSSETATVPSLLVSLAPFPHDSLDAVLNRLELAFPGQSLFVALPDLAPETLQPRELLQLLPYTSVAPSTNSWVLTASDYLQAYKMAKENGATNCLLLGSEAQSLAPEAIRALTSTRADLTIACYHTGPREALVNSAILYPVTRALYGTRSRFPLAIDLCLSMRMAERMAMVAQKFTALNQNDALMWPVSEAASANYSIIEVDAGRRTLPQPTLPDLNTLLAQVAGSLFSDVEAKASYWQRARGLQPPRQIPAETPAEAPQDVQPMLDSFRLAYTNLHEIWSLVLPPNSLLGLKKLSLMPPASFRMPEPLWARIVYDFILAYRLRTINRGHLLGALTPLYLAWVASHILLANGGVVPEAHIEEQAAAFEADKPYFVSRWRWPDRFNP